AGSRASTTSAALRPTSSNGAPRVRLGRGASSIRPATYSPPATSAMSTSSRKIGSAEKRGPTRALWRWYCKRSRPPRGSLVDAGGDGGRGAGPAARGVLVPVSARAVQKVHEIVGSVAEMDAGLVGQSLQAAPDHDALHLHRRGRLVAAGGELDAHRRRARQVLADAQPAAAG